MTSSPDDSLLARLAGGGGEGADPWSELAATEPDHDSPAEAQVKDKKLDSLLDRINRLGSGETGDEPQPQQSPGETDVDDTNGFFPEEPASFRQAQLTDSEVEALVLKFLLARGDAVGREIADQIKLPFVLIDELCAR